MKFKTFFNNLCRESCPRQGTKFIWVNEKIYNKITPRRLVNTCLEDEHQVMLSHFFGSSDFKVCDFVVVMDEENFDGASGPENPFTIIFLKTT